MDYCQDALSKSKLLYDEASDLFPGGVNSPVRAFGSVGGSPILMAKGKGSYLWDVDNNRYVDYVGSWGPAILGHAHPRVLNEIKEALEFGLSFGAPTERENELAKVITEIMPNIEMMRFVSSGTEACMSALRLARGFTGRDKIIKFEGCYHGHADNLLVKAGSGVATLGIPGSPGVPKGATEHTLVAPYNSLQSVEELFQAYKDEVAAVIVEPIAGNAGFIRPEKEFLKGLRRLCSENGTLLIFDEVMTGFRVNLSGAQHLFDIKPDLTTLGKVVGGGMPIAAFGGRRDIMSKLAPSGPIYQAGTLSGNPIAVSSGLATLRELKDNVNFDELSRLTKKLVEGLAEAAKEFSIPFSCDCEGGMFGFFFTDARVDNFQGACKADIEIFKKFFWGMISEGVYLAPSSFEAGFVSVAHTEEDINYTLKSAKKVFASLR